MVIRHNGINNARLIYRLLFRIRCLLANEVNCYLSVYRIYLEKWMTLIKAIQILLNITCNLKWTARGLSPIKLVQTNKKIIKNYSAKQIWNTQYPAESTAFFFITFRSSMSVMLACAECAIEQMNSFYFPTSWLFVQGHDEMIQFFYPFIIIWRRRLLRNTPRDGEDPLGTCLIRCNPYGTLLFHLHRTSSFTNIGPMHNLLSVLLLTCYFTEVSTRNQFGTAYASNIFHNTSRPTRTSEMMAGITKCTIIKSPLPKLVTS